MAEQPAHPSPHPCDAPDIQPRAFLYAVMRDRNLPITRRIDAADRLLRIYGEPPPIAYTVRIGGIPEPTFDTSDLCSTLADCLHRTTPCPWQKLCPHLRDCKTKILEQQMQYMDVKGHA